MREKCVLPVLKESILEVQHASSVVVVPSANLRGPWQILYKAFGCIPWLLLFAMGAISALLYSMTKGKRPGLKR